MAVRAAIALGFFSLASAGSARAQDDPACEQYHEPMAYNLCLAQHGPKANGVGKLHGSAERGPATSYQRYRRSHGGGWSSRTDLPQSVRHTHGRVHMEIRVR
jgi:hypothetical protein